MSISEANLKISGIASAHEFLDQDLKTGIYPYLGYIIEGNGCILYHSGDTCLYEGMYSKLKKYGSLDVIFFHIPKKQLKIAREESNGKMIENLIAISSLALMSTLIYFENTLIKISKYKIKSDKIPKEFNDFKIVHLSDFHSYGIRKDSNKLLQKINEENPNIIVMTGDMVNKYDRNFERFLNLAEALSKKYDIYYILGNHEVRLRKDDLSYIIQKLKEFGIKILSDAKITIIRKKEYINIYGIDIPLSYYKIVNKPSNVEEVINGVLNKCNKKEYNILLAHNPLYFEEYSKQNVDLTLSGHIHGGMIRLPFIGAILSPERKFFPKYSSGIYEINNKKLLVNRGLGHSSPGIRIFNKREIVSITLQC